MGYLGTDMKREEKRRNWKTRHRTQRLSGSLEEACFASILTFDFKAAAIDLFVCSFFCLLFKTIYIVFHTTCSSLCMPMPFLLG